MIRFKPTQNRVKIDIYSAYNTILDDLFNNEVELYSRQLYYISKYRGDKYNDVNLGYVRDEDYGNIVILYLNNGDTKIQSKIILNKKLNRIVNLKTKLYTMTMNFELPIFEDKIPYNTRLNKAIEEFLIKNPHLRVAKDANGRDIISKDYPKNETISANVKFI